MNNVAIVVPTIREYNIKEFVKRWSFTVPLIIVEDNPEPTFDLDIEHHYSWQDIEKDLGSESWIIPRRSDCVRSYGYLKAYQAGYEYIITLDDDCYPVKHINAEQYITKHIANLSDYSFEDRWVSTLENPIPRGYPYGNVCTDRPIKISHGLWQNVIDYDSISQLVFNRYPQEVKYRFGVIGHNKYYPMCGMNLAWKADITSIMYFLLMGQNTLGEYYKYDRFGDIWCGILSKKILDHLDGAVFSGDPLVWHDRASNVWSNYRKEYTGILQNEEFWKKVDEVKLTKSTYKECYKELAENLALDGHYWNLTKRAMCLWSELF